MSAASAASALLFMKVKAIHFRTPQVALRELEPFIRNGRHLHSGKLFSRFGNLRSREVLGNWLICAALNAGLPRARVTFTSDPQGGDGVLYDWEADIGWPTEHVMIPKANPDKSQDITRLIVDAVANKQAKGGSAYARGKVLVVFLDAGLGEWFPNRVTKELPSVDFNEVWVVGLHGLEDKYTYAVVQLGLSSGNAPTWVVRIALDFGSWTVERLQ